MAKNTLEELNNHLFEQIERLKDSDTSTEQFEKEVARSKAIGSLAEVVIRNGQLALDVAKHMNEYRTDGQLAPMPAMLLPGEKK